MTKSNLVVFTTLIVLYGIMVAAPVKSAETAAQTTTTSAPHLNSYTYKNGNNTVCLLVNMTAYFVKQPGDITYNITKNYTIVEAESSCNKLVVSNTKNKFSLTFERTNDTKSYFLGEVDAEFGGVKADASSIHLAEVTMDASYMCFSGITVNMSNNFTFDMKDVQFQAFHVRDKRFATAQVCAGDIEDNIIIPIAIGCALAGLIIIVFIAYFIGRRRVTPRYEDLRPS